MRYLSTMLAALMGVLLVEAFPANATTTKTIRGGNNATYAVIDLEWALRVNNTHTVAVTGTVEAVLARLAQLNPANETVDSGVATTPAESQLYNPTTHNCNKFQDAHGDRIVYGIQYLRKVGGRPTNGPGPGQCGRVSCSYNSAIYWCNDNADETLVLDSYGRVADGALATIHKCTFRQNDEVMPNDFSGQQFYDGDWNVMVRGDSC